MVTSACELNFMHATDVISFLPLQHTPLEKLDRKHFLKGSRGHEQNGGVVAPQPSEDAKEIALMEAKMKKMCELLHEVSSCYWTPIHAHTLPIDMSISSLSCANSLHLHFLSCNCRYLLTSIALSLIFLLYFFRNNSSNFSFLDFLQTIVRTKENIEKKHALTYDEIVQEREEVLFSNSVNLLR